MEDKQTQKKITLFDLAKVSSYLGFTGYGGPAVLGHMKNEIVKKRNWVSEEDFMSSLSMADILPGATGATLIGYLGYKLKGILGWIIAAGLYVLPAFLFTTIIAMFYFKYNNIGFVNKIFIGLGALVVALLINVILNMSKSIFGKPGKFNYKGIIIAVLAFLLSIFLQINATLIYLLSGTLGFFFFYYSKEIEIPKETKIEKKEGKKEKIIWKNILKSHFTYLVLGLIIAGIILYFSIPILGNLMVSFLHCGTFALGAGYSVIPLMKSIAVDQNHWVTLNQFKDGIAIGQITPGPALITAAFIGYNVFGWSGALISILAIFLPSLIFIVIVGGFHERIKHLKSVKVVIKGFLAAFIGIITAIAFQFGQTSLIDWKTWLIFIAALFILVKLKKNILWVIAGTIVLSLIIF